MTVEEFQRARVERERYVFRVLKHKTMDTHGPAQVVLTKLLYSYINVFIKQMRPRLPAALSDGKQALFFSWFGNQIESNQMTKDLSSIFKKAGIKGPVHHTLYRKSAVSQCHARHKEISSNLADLMAHREGTAEKYYRLFEKNKSSVKASKKLHGVMRNGEENDKELSTRKAVKESSESELLTADSPGTERAPWKEDVLTSAAKSICRRNIVAKCHHVFSSRKKSSLTRYCAQKVQKEYTTGSVGNGVKNPKLMQLIF